MPRVAILIAASPTRAFYSQIAVQAVALRKLRWSRWEYSIHVHMGGDFDAGAHAEWLPYLADVDISFVASTRYARYGDWAQADDVFRMAPSDADVLLAMDADTLAVASLEEVLDQVFHAGSVAGVIAHYPFPVAHGMSVQDAWEGLSSGLVDVDLDFAFSHTLLPPDDAAAHLRLTPFYLNFGVVFLARDAFTAVAPRYLSTRPRVMDRMPQPIFSGQVALTLSVLSAGVAVHALPMRFNFPNDPTAEQMYPEELASVVVFHYLRTRTFDRARIFIDEKHYEHFRRLQMTGPDRAFQQSVERVLGGEYPFR